MTINVRTMVKKAGIAVVLSVFLFFILFSGCTTETAPATGTIVLSSSPAGAEIYLDSQYRGSTPSTIAGVSPGQHTLEFRYPGYESWSSVITVPAGESSYFAALTPVASAAGTVPAGSATTSVTTVTVNIGKDPMLVGESNVFSGTATGTNTMLLTVYGPGKYLDGISLVRQNVDANNEWKTTWSPGTTLMPGTYTLEAQDVWKNTTVRKQFKVIGGGIVSISVDRPAAVSGQTLTFSGQCTTNAPNVKLTLFGPGQFGSGVQFPEIAVDGNQRWSFRYTLDAAMPTGQYTMYVYDSPKTTSSNTQFTVGYAT